MHSDGQRERSLDKKTFQVTARSGEKSADFFHIHIKRSIERNAFADETQHTGPSGKSSETAFLIDASERRADPGDKSNEYLTSHLKRQKLVTGEPSFSEMLSLEGDQGWLRLNSRRDGLACGSMSRDNIWSF